MIVLDIVILLTYILEYALNKLHGYSPNPRRPLLPLKNEEGTKFMDVMKELLELEDQLRVEEEKRLS